MHTVAEILGDKGGTVIEIDGGATVFDAVKAMVEANVGAILVTGAPDEDHERPENGRRPGPLV